LVLFIGVDGCSFVAQHEIGSVKVAFLLPKKIEKNLKKSLPPSLPFI